jgi:hypothetical protein
MSKGMAAILSSEEWPSVGEIEAPATSSRAGEYVYQRPLKRRLAICCSKGTQNPAVSDRYCICNVRL